MVGSRSATAAAWPPWVTTSPGRRREQRRRLRADEEFCALLYGHCCEGTYGAPEYGGNRDSVGWPYLGRAGDVQPRGYTDEEVSDP